ncbi:type II toxin-antitoxin system VapC family toxin [Rhodoflexus caldus]|uniref:type II toxin-antitoxin system VapC family toxin n=1 Tax=Rhodoflexus caldus TaxID=2891236 RepID=UPI00202A36DB|nr:type II toxin-antitoxin system VapC family toxin [Rhodoflexus caldus]
MRLLLDTHAFIWYMEGNDLLGEQNRLLIQDSATTVYLSVASVWEMALKVNSGKLFLAKPLHTYIPAEIHIIDIRLEHIWYLNNLPQYHKDPFDRILIATAMIERMPLLSIDSAFHAYPVERIWKL